MTPSASSIASSTSKNRWFYSVASVSMLVLTLIGFQLFYLQGKAYPGRPLTPPIRTLIIVHGCLMTAWMLLAVAQPLLVGTRRVRIHMKLGMFGVALALSVIVVGFWLGIESTRVSPPELEFFGLPPLKFMAIPILSILLFGLFVVIGVANRRRPAVHRPMMLMASVILIGAALARIDPLNALYAGTWCEVVFTGFFMQVVFGAILLAAHCLVFKTFDRWLAAAFAGMAVASAAISLGARTQAWAQIAAFLLG